MGEEPDEGRAGSDAEGTGGPTDEGPPDVPGETPPLRPDAPPFPAPRGEIASWAMFDFANSSFTTVITTVLFSVYFTQVVCADLAAGTADFFWATAQTASQVVVLLTAPILGAIADYSAAKKTFLFATWIGCAVFTVSLGLVGPGDVVLGLVLYAIANVFYSAGENLISAFLPELARPDDMGKVSGYGWSLGYLGGLLSLGLCVPLAWDGIVVENAWNLRMTNVLVGGFFFVCGLPTMIWLRERARKLPLPADGYVRTGFRSVLATLKNVRQFRDLATFLVVFLVYNMGVIIVVTFAGIYAKSTLGFGLVELILLFTVIQVTAALGALAFGLLQDWIGARQAIDGTLVIWLIVCVLAAWIDSKAWFYLVANLAGVAIGGSQSAARALVGVFAPPSKSAEFFGFWGLVWKLSAAVGPLAFGAASALTGSQRIAILITGGFFLAGIVGMRLVDEEAGREAAARAQARIEAGMTLPGDELLGEEE